MKKNKTLKNLMKLADENPMVSMFIINAIDNATREVITNQENVMEELKNSIVAPRAWIGAATEIANVFNSVKG